MTRNQIYSDDKDASSSQKRSKTCAPWSDLNHDLLRLVMMKLGFGDYYSFRGVWKSWRSLAYSDENMFMASMPPMSVGICSDANEKTCYLEDFEGRKFKTILPDIAAGDCIGLTCGYLIFFSERTHDFWLVNPITRKQLHFPDFPNDYRPGMQVRCILDFSPSISKWVFVVLLRNCKDIWFCTAGKGAWNNVSYTFPATDLYAFKGKLYTRIYDPNHHVHEDHRLCELRLDPEPKFTLLKTKNSLHSKLLNALAFISSSENLYVIGWTRDNKYNLLELDLGEMQWVDVPCENKIQEYVIFRSKLNNVGVDVKRESWADPQSWSLGRFASSLDTDNNVRIWGFTAKMWYFPHECMNVDHIDE